MTFENHTYNLMKQLEEEHKSLWRIRKYYRDDASDCGDCLAFWEKLAQDKEAHIAELTTLLKKELE